MDAIEYLKTCTGEETTFSPSEALEIIEIMDGYVIHKDFEMLKENIVLKEVLRNLNESEPLSKEVLALL